MKLLVLGGTSEARELAHRLAGRADIDATISLAGRTRDPAPLPLPTRIGGFGGAEGLADHLRETATDLLVDATHPFAERISANAAIAAAVAAVPLARLARPPWTPVTGDRWIEVDDLRAAAAAIGGERRRVLLTVGRLGLDAFAEAPDHDYVVRSIDDPGALPMPSARLLLDRPPFDAEAEEALMRREAIDVLVTKNSGSAATYGKIAAARALGLTVVIVRTPAPPEVPLFTDIDGLLAWIDAHGAPPSPGSERGE